MNNEYEKLEKAMLEIDPALLQTEDDFVKQLEKIVSNEQSKPLNEQDVELIDEAVEMILLAKNVDAELSDDAVRGGVARVDKRVNEYLQKQRFEKGDIQRRHKKRKLIIIAAVISLLAAFVLISYAAGLDLVSMTREMFLSLKEKEPYKEGNKDLIITYDNAEFASFDELFDKTGLTGVLYWDELPDGMEIESILVSDFGDYVQIDVFFEKIQNEYCIELNKYTDYSQKELKHIGLVDVYITEYDGIVQGEWIYKGSNYILSSSSKEKLIDLINGLKEKE